jgi:2-succinyl-5-enolpyruvyl-6-hydroxy-3-cyclohexene-1-carboxylate synthase
MLDALVGLIGSSPRGLVVAGWGAGVQADVLMRFAEVTGWPVLADPISNLRVPGTISTYDALLRGDAFAGSHRPAVVLRVGGPLTNKVSMQWLDAEIGQVLVDPDGAWLDPHHAVSGRMSADADPLLDALASALAGTTIDDEWREAWAEADASARATIDALIDGWNEPFEGRIARDVTASVPDGGSLVLASSMPVRDAESFAAPRRGIEVLANRGVNGIDGFVSTVLGVAAGSDGPTVGLLGDLCFLHDSNGLLGARDRGLDATFVVVDNDGGGIFSFLAQADLPEHFETVFGTPHGIDLAALAQVHGVPLTEITVAADVGPAVGESAAAGGVRVVLVRTDRATNVARHREVWSAVADRVA